MRLNTNRKYEIIESDLKLYGVVVKSTPVVFIVEKH